MVAMAHLLSSISVNKHMKTRALKPKNFKKHFKLKIKGIIYETTSTVVKNVSATLLFWWQLLPREMVYMWSYPLVFIFYYLLAQVAFL